MIDVVDRAWPADASIANFHVVPLPDSGVRSKGRGAVTSSLGKRH
jgi:hypothetical protein